MTVVEGTSLEEVLAQVATKVRRQFGHRADADDLVQEAQIHAWRDVAAEDSKDLRLIKSRAVYRVLHLISDKSPDSYFGSPNTSAHVRAETAGEEVRQKIRDYITSYTRMHGHPPTGVEISRAVGITQTSVSKHMKRLYLFTGPKEYSQVSLDAPRDMNNTSGSSVADDIRFGYSFENELVSAMDTCRYMREVLTDDRERKFFYLRFFEGWTSSEIGETEGCHFRTAQNVVNRAKARIQEEMMIQ